MLCENVTRAGENPAFDTKCFRRVGDVTDSIEVLQASCKGLNPFRSTKFIALALAQSEEAKVSKAFYVQVQILPRVFLFHFFFCYARVAQMAEAIGLNPIHVKVRIFSRAFFS